MARRHRRGLSADEAALWAQVTTQVRPLDAADGRDAGGAEVSRQALMGPAPGPEPATDPAAPAPENPHRIGSFRIGCRAAPAPERHDRGEDVAAALARHAPAVDGRTQARLKRGKLRPEARLDLHGMTLASAHPALSGFIRDAHARNLRLVLVITGKGREGGAGTPAQHVGVLRRQVPHWLRQAPLAPLVVQITPAHRRHGGEGAYYVYLRRQRG